MCPRLGYISANGQTGGTLEDGTIYNLTHSLLFHRMTVSGWSMWFVFSQVYGLFECMHSECSALENQSL